MSRTGFTREDMRPDDLPYFDFIKTSGARRARLLEVNGAEVICPRCKRPAAGWPLQRPNRCSPADWVQCLRDPEVVLADIAQRQSRASRKRT